jgi:hypothetical protein
MVDVTESYHDEPRRRRTELQGGEMALALRARLETPETPETPHN